jgi:hypothetical protein
VSKAVEKFADQTAERTRIFQQCNGHMIDAVEACDVLSDPCPHFILRGILPDDVYRAALNFLPDKGQYDPFNYSSKSPDRAASRWRFDMSDAAIATLNPEAQGFWLGVRDALGCVELKRAVFRKLSAGLAYRYGVPEQEAVDLPGYPLPALFREEQGYSIKPHPDTRKKVITFQVALAQDETQEHLGTQLYRRSLNPLSLTRQPRGFDVVKTAPFVPNAAFAFVVTNTLTRKSWHGRTTLSATDGVRNTLLNIWYSKLEKGHPDIVGDDYGSRRAA